jgi:hypothetical protein
MNPIRFGFTFVAVLLVLVSTIAGAAVPVTEFPIPNVNKFSLRHHGWLRRLPVPDGKQRFNIGPIIGSQSSQELLEPSGTGKFLHWAPTLRC